MRKTLIVQTYDAKTGNKRAGGTWTGEISESMEEWASRYDLVESPSGAINWVDKDGQPIYLRVQICPSDTQKGRDFLKECERKREEAWQKEKEQIEREEEEMAKAMRGLSHAEIVKRLKGE